MRSESPVDHIIHQEIRKAQRLRREARELSRAKLAEKFGVSYSTIHKIINGYDYGDDFELIRQCHEEARLLNAQLCYYTEKAIAERYGRSRDQVRYIGRKGQEVAA